MDVFPVNWDSVPEVMNKEQFFRICHISKSTALHLRKSGKVPCEWSGKKTRCYKIRKEDVKAYLEERAIFPELYSAPKGWYGTHYVARLSKALPEDTVILTAGCAKYRYNKLNLGDIEGIPRVLDAGQCNDSYSLAVIAMKLQEIFGLDDINDLPIIYNIAWYEQKAVIVLLALLHLGIKNIHLGPTLPAFLSPGVARILTEKFGIQGITEPQKDMERMEIL